MNADRSLDIEGTQCAHIFAESTNQNIELGSHKVCPYFICLIFDNKILHTAGLRCDDVGGHAPVMVRFGYTQLPDDLKGSNVHRLENVMTLVPTFHLVFDPLKV
jgi:hypothetical protein